MTLPSLWKNLHSSSVVKTRLEFSIWCSEELYLEELLNILVWIQFVSGLLEQLLSLVKTSIDKRKKMFLYRFLSKSNLGLSTLKSLEVLNAKSKSGFYQTQLNFSTLPTLFMIVGRSPVLVERKLVTCPSWCLCWQHWNVVTRQPRFASYCEAGFIHNVRLTSHGQRMKQDRKWLRGWSVLTELPDVEWWPHRLEDDLSYNRPQDVAWLARRGCWVLFVVSHCIQKRVLWKHLCQRYLHEHSVSWKNDMQKKVDPKATQNKHTLSSPSRKHGFTWLRQSEEVQGSRCV